MKNRDFLIISATFFVFTFSKSVFFKFNLYALQLGIAQEWIGLIISADSIAFIILQPFVHALLGKFSNRALMSIALLIGSVAMLPYFWLKDAWSLCALRFINGSAYAIFITCMMSSLVQCIPEGKSGRAFLWISLMPALSYAIIPALVEFLRLSFPAAALTMGISILAITPLPQLLNPSMRLNINPERQIGYRAHMRRLIFSPSMAIVLGTLGIFSAYSAVFFYLEGFARGAGIEAPSIFFTLSTVSMITIRIVAAAYIDRINKIQTAFYALLLLCLCHAMIPHTSGVVMFWANGTLSGLGWGLAMPLMNAILYELSKDAQRVFNLNMAMLALQLSFFSGPFTGGLLISSLGYGAVFYAAAIVVGLLAVSLWLLNHKGINRCTTNG